MSTISSHNSGIASSGVSGVAAKTGVKSSVASSQQQQREARIMHEFQRPRTCCCGLIKEEKFLKLIVLAVVLMDILSSIGAIAFVYVFAFSTDSTHFQTSYREDHDAAQRSEIETYVVLLLLPNLIIFFIKTWYGIRWIRLDYKRSAYQTYYMTSQSFYTSFTVQEILIIAFSWNVFVYWIRYVQICVVALCFLFFFVMRINMKFLDKQNFAINLIRREAAMKNRQETITQKAVFLPEGTRREIEYQARSSVRSIDLIQSTSNNGQRPLQSSQKVFGVRTFSSVGLADMADADNINASLPQLSQGLGSPKSPNYGHLSQPLLQKSQSQRTDQVANEFNNYMALIEDQQMDLSDSALISEEKSNTTQDKSSIA